ncbi:hypothetical protein Pmani_029952 [Petrolisthes manimaculis]|uniref:Uncharacterized protein n=1 Tax=Petrolisthes manimaculis TaxID=1843537 RepID=A0AAE1TU01_9EUCA|nr:hypothetical protein Pmani_029952 [Petrolisthes manimaculis]
MGLKLIIRRPIVPPLPNERSEGPQATNHFPFVSDYPRRHSFSPALVLGAVTLPAVFRTRLVFSWSDLALVPRWKTEPPPATQV